MLLLRLRSCWALASRGAEANWMAGTAMAVVAMCPMKWRRDIPLGTIRRSDIGRIPPKCLSGEAAQGAGVATRRRPFPISDSRRTRWS